MPPGQLFSLEEEASVLSSMILEPSCIKLTIGSLQPEHFSTAFHSRIYQALLSLFTDEVDIDKISVANKYSESNGRILDPLGVISTMVEKSNFISDIPGHANHLVELWKRRQALQIYKSASDQVQDLARPLSDALLTSTEALFALAEPQERGGVVGLSREALPEALRRAERARNGEGDVGVVPLPWSAVAALSPLRPGEVSVVCGRPAMAKSAWVLNIALHAARQGIPVGIFSLEMNKTSLALRLISLITGINSRDIEKGKTTDEEHQLVVKAIGELGKLPIHIDDNPDLDELSFINESRLAHQKYQLGLIIVDYLTLMTRKKNEDQVQAVGSCARTIRKTARKLNIPILEVCQVSRNCEYREDKRPILSDLRASGEIEQEADIVIALYRDDYYLREKSKFPGMCEVIVLKHRNGPLGTAYLQFKSETTRFFPLAWDR